MPHLLDATEADADLPRRTGVVVIGAGIIGVSTALTLAERGVAVTVLEKGRVGAEQSSRNWGWCRTTGRDLAEVPLAVESVRMWDGMAARIGADVGFRRAGVAYVAESARELEGHAAWLDRAQEYQVGTRCWTRTRRRRCCPAPGGGSTVRSTPPATARRSLSTPSPPWPPPPGGRAPSSWKAAPPAGWISRRAGSRAW